MTDPYDVDGTDLPAGRPRSSLSVGLNFLGIVVVGFWLVAGGVRGTYPPVVIVLGVVALAGWAVRECSRAVRVRVTAGVVMVVVGSLVVIGSDNLLVVPVIVGIVLLQATLSLPVWAGVVGAVVAAVEIGLAAMLGHGSSVQLAGSLGGLALGVAIGFTRRQARLAEQQHRQAEEEQRRADVLAEKSRAARDIHDVLAHSLGGLVLQLDAVDALLEAGRVTEATTRAADARRLAADGLAEARRAVATLRDEQVPTSRTTAATAQPPTPRTSAVPAAPAVPRTLHDLVRAHRAFGGEITVDGDTDLGALDARHADAVVATATEALSNARKHAPGTPVLLSVHRSGGSGAEADGGGRRDGRGEDVEVVVRNPIPSDGHGIVGMRERFAELADGSTVTAGPAGDAFVVAMRVPLAAAGPLGARDAAAGPLGARDAAAGPLGARDAAAGPLGARDEERR